MSVQPAQGPPAPEPYVRVEGLTVAYGSEVVLSQVSLEVARGEVVVVAGPSGCGKSTLLKALLGLLAPAAGRVEVGGVEITTAGERELAGLRRRIGVLFQSGALLGSFTLLDNVLLPLSDFSGLSAEAARLAARSKLALVGLAGYENHLPSEISGGQKKRAGLARAMALDPEALFFDEPSAGLDPVTAAELDRLIVRVNRGTGATMVIVSHELASIMNIAHRVLLLDKRSKGIIAQGPPAELRDRSRDPRVVGFFQRRPAEEGE